MTLHPFIRNADRATKNAERYTAPHRLAMEDELADLMYGLVRALHPDYVLETGTCLGHTSRKIGEALARNGHGRLDTLEADPARAREARDLLHGLPITVHAGKYQEFAPPVDREYAFALFDATRFERHQEFHHFEPWLPQGAIIAFHDMAEFHEGARANVEALDASGFIRALYIPAPRGLCLAEVL